MRILLLILILWATLFPATAQNIDTALADRFLLNFSVPDMPAFKALGTDPSNILHPSDLKKFAASISPFFSNGQGVVPKNFALEFAPWKLLAHDWDIHKYNKGWNSALYNSGFSIGTINDSTQFSTKLALGYRLTIAKKGDILKAVYKQNSFRKMLQQTTINLAALNELKDHWLFEVQKLPDSIDADEAKEFFKNNQAGFLKYTESLFDGPITDTVVERMFHNFASAFNLKNKDDIEGLIAAAIGLEETIAQREENILAKYRDSMWNANRFDIALAFVGESKDSLLKSAQFASFNVWATYAIRAGKKGQLLLGTNFVLPRTEKNDSINTRFAITGNIRYYLGNNSIKGFLEGQYKYSNYTDLQRSLMFNIGAEFRIGNLFWAVASTGIENSLGEKDPVSKLIAGISLKYGFNQPK